MMNTAKDFIFRRRFEILLTIIVLTGYYQISFFIHPLKFGAVFFHYPWRYDIVENIRHGTLPLWYFQQHVGVPVYADPQSGAWYPFVWLFSLFGRYSYFSFHIEFTAHILIAAFGMMWFAKELNISKFTSFLLAVAYVFSGVFSDNVLTSWVISYAWIPVIMALTVRLSKTLSLRDITALSLSLSMLILGGYPAFTIVLAYIIIIFTAYTFYKKTKLRTADRWPYLATQFAVVFLTLLMTSVLLLSVYISTDYIGRTQPVDITYASTGILSVNSLISFLLPYSAVCVGYDIIPEFGTFFTMANSYFGIIPLALIFTGFFIQWKHKKIFLLFVAAGLVFMLFSLGEKFIVFKLFYKFLPGFNLFRFPNFIRLFFVIFFLTAAGFALDAVISLKKYKPLINTAVIFTGIYFLIIIIAGKNTSFSISEKSFYDFFKSISFSQRLILQSIFQIFLLTALVFSLKFTKISKKTVMAVALIADLVISFQLNYIYSGYAIKISVAQTDNKIKKHLNTVNFQGNKNIWKNSVWNYSKPGNDYFFDFGYNEYEGKISTYGNGSFRTKDYENLINDKQISEIILSNPVVYITNKIEPLTPAAITDTNVVYLNKDVYKKFSYELQNRKPAEIENVVFEPNRVVIRVKGSGMLAFLQNYYPGWKVFVNGEKQDLLKANLSFMGVFVPGNENTESRVVFVYERNDVKTALYISVISFILVFLIFLWTMFYKRKPA